MKVIGLVCSPRLNGNTQVLVEEALRAAGELGAETELYPAGQKNIAPCDGCDFCQGSGQCRIGDDMQELYTKLQEADGIIFGSPVYWWGVSAQAKAVMDRMYLFRTERNLAGKAGGALVVARTRGQATALSALIAFLTGQRLVVAAAGSGLGDERGDVRKDARGMEEARRVGRAVATVARAGRLSPSTPR